MRYHFGPFTLDVGARELLADSEPVALEPRTFAVLAHLVGNRHRVVPKAELLDEVWGDRFVSESALTTQIKHVRTAIGDSGQTQALIKTVHRVGYRFVGQVTDDEGGTATPTRAGLVPRWTPSPVLVGRESDIEQIERRFEDRRLVTITGPGGVGKTSVAVSLLEPLTHSAPDGVWVCELADTRDPEAVDSLVLAAVGEGQQSDADPDESLLRALEGRRGLLLLDNCEHVVERIRPLVGRILDRCGEVRVLATSREALGVGGESVHPLEPLDLDAAVACFVDKVEQSGGQVDPADPSLSDLCCRLDCLPLALELAAVHSRVLSPTETVELLADRFRLLRDDTASSGRHSSLHQTIAWSWDMLTDEDRELLARLTVLVGLFSLDDARAVALPDADPLDVVDALGRLVSRSLVVPLPARSGVTRFRLLESIREFAAEQLADPSSRRRLHAEHFAALSQSLDEDLQTDAVEHAIGTMRSIWTNLRAAVRYAADEHDTETVRRIISAVGPFADVFQHYEVLQWCDHAQLDEAPDGTPRQLELVANTLAVQARMLAHRGHHVEGRGLATRAHRLAETHATLLSVLWCAYYAGDLDVVVRSADRLLDLSRSDRGFDRGFAEGFSAIVKAVRQEPDISSTAVSPADAERGILGTQDCLTEGLRLCTSDPERAVALLEAVVESAIRNDYRLHLGAAASTLTQIALPGRPVTEAMRTLRRTLQLYLDRSMWTLISADTVMAAKLLSDQGELEVACRLIGARNASGYAVGLSEVLRALLQADLEARLGSQFDELALQGSSWRPPDAGRAAVEALGRVLERLEDGRG
jgi:predicted ATPase/DNA-binding winged helix-turn-helix (wHTH) protein